MTLPATSTLCGLFSFLLAGSPIFYSPAPRGDCSNCCAIREREDIKFLLYTRNNPNKAQTLFLGDDKRLAKSNFNFEDSLKVFIHGFSESATAEKQSGQEIKNSFLKAGNYNVILIDWSPMTAVPWYTNSVDNLPRAARYVARFLRFLIGNGYETKAIHLIGFSLGAEVSGFVGKQLQEWGVVLQRITALDPALPLFESGSANRRLASTDARFVDVIHTDGGLLGNPEPMGHADFYPNGGRALQPGCARQEIANNRWLGIIIGCSHQRAWEYFIESIRRPEAFLASKCEPSQTTSTCKIGSKGAFMGMGADRRLRGKFFLDTNDAAPFGRNTKQSSATTTGAQLQSLPPTAFADVNNNDNELNDTLINSNDQQQQQQRRRAVTFDTTTSRPYTLVNIVRPTKLANITNSGRRKRTTIPKRIAMVAAEGLTTMSEGT